jgi:hypothetical protein
MKSYTEEQQAVIDSNAESIVVNAFAGTGKTTMLVGYANRKEKQKILYLAFNKAIAEEAKARFSGNVVSKTSHSLAFGQFGRKYKDKLGNVRPYHVKNSIKIDRDQDGSLLISELALSAVNAFLISSDTSFTVKAIPSLAAKASGFSVEEVFEVAKKILIKMKDPSDFSIPMPHDGYLKLYQLSNPNLSNYDCILLDEAQDTNPCLYSLFESQQTNKVIVGDEHQNIYTFRGAMNAMKKTKGELHALTHSFRFGQPVADVANAILSTFKDERRHLVGLGGDSTVLPPQKMYTAFLHRTNAGLFDRAIDLMQAGVRIYYVGGIKNYNMDVILDVWNLMDGNKSAIKDHFVKSFQNIDALENYAEAVDDKELKARLSVVKKYTFKIPRLIERLEANEEKVLGSSNATLTTAHKSKGMEWDQVVLGDDFSEAVDGEGKPRSTQHQSNGSDDLLSKEEANLLYVASTRAQKNLVLNKSLSDLMLFLR